MSDFRDVIAEQATRTPQIAALDVPLPVVESQTRTRAGCLAEQAHLLDPADPLFVRLACEHGDCCSTDADYPNWTPGGQA